MRLSQIRDYYRVRPGYWFKPKRFGWGAVPVTWQGWLATAVLVGIGALLANLAEHGRPAFLALLVPLVLGFIWLCWAKTDGDWYWRWGDWD